MRTLIGDFKQKIQTKVITVHQILAKHFHKTPKYGLVDSTLVNGSSEWPSEQDLKNISQKDLQTLKLAKISYYKVGSVLSMKFTLNNGMESTYAGKSGRDKCNMETHFRDDRQVALIKVKASKNWVNEIRFIDN